VTVQRRTSFGWSFAGNGTLQKDGSFTAGFDAEDGVYRARVVPAASTGLATGYSPPLVVVGS
jgi:hypothetical protein